MSFAGIMLEKSGATGTQSGIFPFNTVKSLSLEVMKSFLSLISHLFFYEVKKIK